MQRTKETTFERRHHAGSHALASRTSPIPDLLFLPGTTTRLLRLASCPVAPPQPPQQHLRVTPDAMTPEVVAHTSKVTAQDKVGALVSPKVCYLGKVNQGNGLP
jgi:hypothetical protein